MKKIAFSNLKIFLSSVVGMIVILMTALLVVLSYNSSYNSVEKAYINQLANTSKDIDSQVSRFYSQQMANALFFSKNKTVAEAIDTGRFDRTNAMFRNFSAEHGLYENIFISTPEENPRIVSAVAGIGTRWGKIGYDENIRNNLGGREYISEPMKSPVTGLPVCLFSAPIKKGDSIIGILGIAVNVGEFSCSVLNGVKVAKTGYPFITTLDGIIIGHPKKEYILKLDIKKFEWGQKMLNSSSGEVIRYNFEGIDKLVIAQKNDKYRLMTAISMKVSDINDEARMLALKMILSGVLAVVVACLVIYMIISRRLSPLKECSMVMQEMSEGNLALRYTGVINRDEIGDIAKSLNGTMEQFEKMMSDIMIASQNLSQAVEQIASGNQNLSQRTSEQASSLEEIASTIEQAAAAINQNSENAIKARQYSEASAARSSESNSIAREAVSSITEMNESSKKVVDIISLIDEIAFQTNLLALNAAIEAARAGDHGKGFAVVAHEVRNLAQRSGNAAKEIEILIKDTVVKVEKSTDLVNRTSTALREIEESARTTAQTVNEITQASLEQKQGINQINTAISEMDNMTQQNAALVEETASASEQMANQAVDLLEMVNKFKTGSVDRNVPRLGGTVSAKDAVSSHKPSGNGNGKNHVADHAGTDDHALDEMIEMRKRNGCDDF